MRDDPAAAGDHPPHRQARLRILLQRRIAHPLFHFEAPRFHLPIAWNRFVNVSRHVFETLQAPVAFLIAFNFWNSGLAA